MEIRVTNYLLHRCLSEKDYLLETIRRGRHLSGRGGGGEVTSTRKRACWIANYGFTRVKFLYLYQLCA